MRGRFRRQRIAPEEMNITAFMNLMVILVPFLLVTAVFSRMAVLELNLPPASSAGPAKKELQLEVTIRPDALEVGDRSTGLIRRVAKGANGYDYKALAEVLLAVKRQFPQVVQATVLSEPETPYDTLVQVMDALRVGEVVQNGALTKVELFPEIGVGDAPTRSVASGRKS